MVLVPRTTAPHRVFIVEDHPVFARGLSQLIAEDGRLLLCGVATNVRMALDQLAEVAPDVLVVDLSLGDASGLELIKSVRLARPGVHCLVISMHDESLYGERALRAGAGGYVMKHEAGETMLEAIRAVAQGRIWVSEALGARMLLKAVHGPRAESGSPLHVLSDRELEVFRLIGDGLGTQEIGRALHISAKTVESHRLNIRQKLNLKSSRDLVRQAMQWIQESVRT